ncbi:MAG: hypothetical protein WHS88_11005 [Anaerohalosphaeraceae bacterium]
MNKYIGLDMDSKKTVACVIEDGCPDRYYTLGREVDCLRRFLRSERTAGFRVEAAFEISGQAGIQQPERSEIRNRTSE